MRQLTTGPLHHFFGYIGHVQNIPWNQSGRYIVALRTPVRDHLPDGSEPAEIVLLDTQNDYAARVVDQCRAWNPQQGTMLYWNPQAQETQFFFNDRDPETNKVFCVLFDISRGRQRRARSRISASTTRPSATAAWRSAAANSWRSTTAAWAGCGASPAMPARSTGRATCCIRPTTACLSSMWPPANKKLLVSFQQLAAALRGIAPAIDQQALFINHTLWSRDDSRIYFYVRGGWDVKPAAARKSTCPSS